MAEKFERHPNNRDNAVLMVRPFTPVQNCQTLYLSGSLATPQENTAAIKLTRQTDVYKEMTSISLICIDLWFVAPLDIFTRGYPWILQIPITNLPITE